MNSFLHVFLSQLKDKELIQLVSNEIRWHRGALIRHLSSSKFDKAQWETLKELESRILERREEGKCINPETGRPINLNGPTYERLLALGYDFKPISIEAIQEKTKYPKIMDKVIDDVQKGEVDLYEDQLSLFSDELLLSIALRLDRKSLASLCCINKRFFLISEEPSLNKILCGEFEASRFSQFGNHFCYLDAKGKAYVWGPNRNGRLGLGKGLRRKNIHAPFPVDIYGKKIRSVITSSDNTAYVTTQGRLYISGSNTGGRLGVGKQNSKKKLSHSHVPVQPLLDAKIRVSQVVFWNSAVAILSTEGHLYAWGKARLYGNIVYPPKRFLHEHNIHKICCAQNSSGPLWVLTDKTTIILKNLNNLTTCVTDVDEFKGYVYQDIVCPYFLDTLALKEISEDQQSIDVWKRSFRYHEFEYVLYRKEEQFKLVGSFPLAKGDKVQKIRIMDKTLAYLTESGKVIIYQHDGRHWNFWNQIPLENVQDFYFFRKHMTDKDLRRSFHNIADLLLFTEAEATHFYQISTNELIEIQTDDFFKGKGRPFDE